MADDAINQEREPAERDVELAAVRRQHAAQVQRAGVIGLARQDGAADGLRLVEPTGLLERAGEQRVSTAQTISASGKRRRIAVAAQAVMTQSPTAEKRTMRAFKAAPLGGRSSSGHGATATAPDARAPSLRPPR